MGTPLIGITIQQALSSSYCKDLYVSTDSEDIAEVAIKYGAKCLELRPKNLADDHSSKFDVWKNHLNSIESKLNISFDYFFDLDCTCPLRPDGDIDNMISSFLQLEKKYDGLITVCDSRKTHILIC